MNNRAIGVMDSGIGGLTVVREIVKLLPVEKIAYVGDSLNSPYGPRTVEDVYRLAKRMMEFLLSKKVKLIVVACNTITVSNISRLREDYPNIPIIGTVPVVKKAAAISKNKRIGILSTTATANSWYQKELIKNFSEGVEVFNFGTDVLVPLIEEGGVNDEKIDKELSGILKIFKEKNIDTLALGCTHFPFLREKIQNIVGKRVQILDSGEAIARQVARVLERNDDLGENKKVGHKFYLTANATNSFDIVNVYFGNKFPGEIEEVKL